MGGELVEQGRRMVPSKLAWTSSRFYGEFSKRTTAVKAELEIKKEEPMDTNDRTVIEPTKVDDAESTSSTTSSPTPPLFTLTPLVQLDLPCPAPQDKTNEEATVDVSDKEMTECEEFSCRLVLPRHRGYLAELRLGDGLTINLDRHVFAQIEEGMREALRNKEGRSRISTQDRKIAIAVIRKARRKTKAKSPKKQTEPETTEEPVENLPLNNNNENITKEKRIENSEDVADVIEDEEREQEEDENDGPGDELEEPVSPPPSDSNNVILIEDEEEPLTTEENCSRVESGTGVAVAALIRQLLLNAAVDPCHRRLSSPRVRSFQLLRFE